VTNNEVAEQPETSRQSTSSIRREVELGARYLPVQGPIEVFVYFNTLEPFEELPFHEGVKAAMRLYGAQPYLTEAQYRELLDGGRITIADLQEVLKDELGPQDSDQIDLLGTRSQIRLAMLRHPMHVGPDAELRWAVAETDALHRFRDEVSTRIRETMLDGTRSWFTEVLSGPEAVDDRINALVEGVVKQFGRQHQRWSDRTWEVVTLKLLWQICHDEVSHVPAGKDRDDNRPLPRQILQRATGQDINRYVHDILIKFCGAFLDQGYAAWKLPHRDEGLYQSFLSLYSQERSGQIGWMRGLREELLSLRRDGTTAEESIADSIERLGIPAADRQEFITKSLLSLRGWAGMIWQLEHAPDWVVRPVPDGTLVEFLAIQLILECRAITSVGRESLEASGTLHSVLEAAESRVPTPQSLDVDRRAFLLFQVAQLLGWHPASLLALRPEEWTELVGEVENFSELERRRVFHEAYERQYRVQAMNAFALHSQRRSEQKSNANKGKPQDAAAERRSFQLMCCIDDREESFRRHLEEVAPQCETFGAAGFFAVAMNYRGAADSFYKPLCPVVITPAHYVQEDVGYTFEGIHRSRAQLRSQLGRATYLFHTRSRTFLGGMLAGITGSLATAPLVARVLFPHLTSRIRSRFGSLLKPPPVTRLQLLRDQDSPGDQNGHIGYSLTEMAGMVERLLQDIGLTETAAFSRLFIVCGHGSASLNNPHESSYCCGACAGKRGGPNARAFAEMANDWRVRAMVAEKGLRIPDDTVFIGAYHDTCEDSVVYYDLDRLPTSHRSDFEVARIAISEALKRNAHERCRRFAGAPLTLTPDEALKHVESRGQDLAQPRPEYDHATNAMCIVGRREWTRGLLLDRRAFLTSYDPSQDDEESSILLRILAAAIPVCAGINLSFYFSTVDNVKYGSGSKLPHNVVSLLGVMEGSCSDLRTGVYQQVCEIHEPMRLLFVIETTPEAMLSIMDRHAVIGRLCRGGWVQIAVIDAETSKLHLLHKDRFEPYEPSIDQLPELASSLACYQGSRENLPFRSIHDAERA
jgi:uncharacterized protein